MNTLAESVAATVRYGDNAVAAFGGEAEVIWESGDPADYQGSANILLRTEDGRFVHYEWSYGSCSGCDTWEANGSSDDAIESEMRNTAAWFDDRETLGRYLRREDPAAAYPASNPTDGGIAGMGRMLFGGAAQEFGTMAQAWIEWDAANPPPVEPVAPDHESLDDQARDVIERAGLPVPDRWYH